MAEAAAAIGLVASILQLVDLSTKVSLWLKEFSAKSANAPKYCQAIATQLETLTFILRRIQERIGPGFNGDEIVQQLQALVHIINGQVTSIQRQLATIIPDLQASKSRRVWSVLKGALNETKLRQLSEDLGRSIGILNLFQGEGQSLLVGQLHHQVLAKVSQEHATSRDMHRVNALESSLNSLTMSLAIGSGQQTMDGVTSVSSMTQHVPVGSLQSWVGGLLTQEDLDKALKVHTPGTCSWILQRDVFVDWLSTASSAQGTKLLWVRGDPGFGKTIICANIVHHLQEQYPASVAYFFCTADEKAKCQPLAVVKSWVAQMIEQNREATKVAREAYIEMGGHEGRLLTTHNIWTLFKRICQSLPSLFFIVDGFDECEKASSGTKMPANEAREFLEQLTDVVPHAPCRVLFTSRESYNLRSVLPKMPEFSEYEIKASDTFDDIKLFTTAVIASRLSGKPDALKQELLQATSARSNGMFLWVQLLGQRLHQDRNAKELRKLVDETPIDISQTYERDLNQLLNLSDERDYAIAMLRWILFAQRPLTVRELIEAQAIELGDDLDHDLYPADNLPDQWDETEITNRIRRLCGSLVKLRNEIDQDQSWQHQTVQLVHFSAREYLMKTVGPSSSISRMTLFRDLQAEHDLLSRLCLRYLSYQEIGPKVPQSDEEMSHLARTYPFLAYATPECWIHVACCTQRSPELDKQINHFFDPNSFRWLHWAFFYECSFEEKSNYDSVRIFMQSGRVSPVYYASALGFEHLLELLHEKGCQFGIQGRNDESALHAAAKWRHLEAARFLVDRGLSLDSRDSSGRTPLFMAAQLGHAKLVDFLARSGADVNAQEPMHGLLPSHVASLNGYTDAVRVLVDNNADFERSSWGSHLTPLYLALTSGSLPTVKCILEATQIDLAIKDRNGRPPFHYAVGHDNLEIVRYFVEEAHVDLGQTDAFGRTPFACAVEKGHIEIVRYLLENAHADDATVKRKNTSAVNSPLYIAAVNGNLDVLKYLFDQGMADRRTPEDANDITLMFAAVESGSIETLEYLVNRQQLDLLFEDADGWTLLHNAASSGCLTMFKYILQYQEQNSIAADLESILRETQLGYIRLAREFIRLHSEFVSRVDGSLTVSKDTRWCHLDLIKLLLERCQSRLLVKDDEEWTLLHAAVALGDVEMFDYITRQDSKSLDYTNIYDEKPMQIACKYGRLSVMKRYFEQGYADNEILPYELSLLHCAAIYGQVKSAKFLIDQQHIPVNSKAQDGSTPLHVAARFGHIDITETLLASETADRVPQDHQGNTPLFIAVECGRVEFVKAFFDRCGGKNFRMENGGSLLHAAATFGHIEILEFLLAKDLTGVDARDNCGETPLLLAAKHGRIEMVKFLIDMKGSDLHVRNDAGQTTLYVSAQEGRSETVRYLLTERQMDVNERSDSGRTPLHIAAGWGSVETVQVLLEHQADMELRDDYGLTPLCSAAFYGHDEAIRKLLAYNARADVRPTAGWTPIHIAAEKGHLETVRCLLECPYIDVNILSDSGSTPLYHAAGGVYADIVEFLLLNGADIGVLADGGTTSLAKSAAGGHLEVVEILLKKKSEVNQRRDSTGWTALIEAARNGHCSVVEVLLQHGADPNIITNKGSTALHISALRGHTETVNLLLQHNASTEIATKTGLLPIHQSVQAGHIGIMQLLLQSVPSADVNFRNRDGNTLLHFAATSGHLSAVRKLIELHAEADPKNDSEWTPVHCAAEQGHVEILAYLQSHGADLNAQTADGFTPLRTAVDMGKLEVVKYLCSQPQTDIHEVHNIESTNLVHVAASRNEPRVLEFLLEQGVDPNVRDSVGETPLFYAVLESQTEAVSVLVERSADLTIRNTIGWTMFHVAAYDGNIEIYEILCGPRPDVPSKLKTHYGETALYLSCSKGRLEMVDFLVKRDLNAHELLATAEKYGRTPLHAAANEGHVEVAKMLVELYPVGCSAVDEAGMTPLHLAAYSGRVDMLEFLIGHLTENSSHDLYGSENWNILSAAASSGQVDAIKWILSRPTVSLDIDSLSCYNMTPLHHALHAKSYEAVTCLLERGAKVNIVDGFGRTVLDWATVDSKLARILQSRCISGATTDSTVQDKALQQSLLRISKSILETKTSRCWTSFNTLGRCLLYLNEPDAALIAFQYELDKDPSTSTLTFRASCNVCEETISGTRSLCVLCPDLDLCTACMEKIAEEPTLESCVDHPFLEVPMPEVDIESLSGLISAPAEEWLSALVERYTPPAEDAHADKLFNWLSPAVKQTMNFLLF